MQAPRTSCAVWMQTALADRPAKRPYELRNTHGALAHDVQNLVRSPGMIVQLSRCYRSPPMSTARTGAASRSASRTGAADRK
jgi:hypothetical protein